jgi:hypothetical protein
MIVMSAPLVFAPVECLQSRETAADLRLVSSLIHIDVGDLPIGCQLIPPREGGDMAPFLSGVGFV